MVISLFKRKRYIFHKSQNSARVVETHWRELAVGLFCITTIIAGAKVISTLDRLAEEASKVRELEGELKALKDAPRVFLLPKGTGFKCENIAVRREYEKVAAEKCEQLASVLIVGRRTD